MSESATVYYESEIGLIEIRGTTEAVVALNFVKERRYPVQTTPVLDECITQLDEYFAGKRQDFALPMQPDGTPFQKKVWAELTRIPYAQTIAYRDLANAIGNIQACRAVGNANGKNKISIIIPCHRVIGSNGKLTGYGGELWRKEWLLNHERKSHD